MQTVLLAGRRIGWTLSAVPLVGLERVDVNIDCDREINGFVSGE